MGQSEWCPSVRYGVDCMLERATYFLTEADMRGGDCKLEASRETGECLARDWESMAEGIHGRYA